MSCQQETRKDQFRLIRLCAGLMAVGLVWGGWQFAGSQGTAWAQNQSKASKKTPQTLHVDVQLQPDPPRQRKNVVTVAVKDATGKPVDQAQVTVEYSMPAMGSMPEMRGAAKVHALSDGRYEAPFDLVMGGTWTLDVTVTAPTGATASQYEFTVGKAGLQPVQAKPEPARK
jgi:hypothetical protein